MNQTKSFIEWLQDLKPKRKFYIWTHKQKADVQEACQIAREIYLYMRVEIQDISYEKAVEILQLKYSL